MIAQTQEALEAAAQAERLGLIGVLALLVIVAATVIVWLVRKQQRDSDAEKVELKARIDTLLEDNVRLRSMYDRVLVLAASASAQAAEEVRRLTDGRAP